MLKVRLARFGQKGRPYFHVVVTHSEKPRDGRFIEQIGSYDPRKPDSQLQLDEHRFDHWLQLGAAPSTRIAHMVRRWRAAKAVAKTAV